MPDWGKTLDGILRLGVKDHFNGRHIIARDTPIDGGVYIGSAAREAIVVDTAKYPCIGILFEDAYRRSKTGNVVHKDRVLPAIYSVVDETFPKKEESDLQDLLNQYGIVRDDKAAIDLFIALRTGVCRHRALTAGAVTEMFTKRGILQGRASIDRNTDVHPLYNHAGHAWVRYTSSDSQVWIMDTSLGFQGLLRDGLKVWNYARPGEIVK